MIEPLKVIYFDSQSNEFVFDEKGYYEMLLSWEDGISNLPVAIVSIVGDARKGKSFLLNFFLRYLQRHDQEDWIGDLDEPLRGFSWRDGVERDTVGIVLWPKPFVLTRKDGSKIVVILMDTQGFYDDHTNHDTVSQFFTIATIISSIQIYNQKGTIQSNDITILSKFSDYADRVANETGVKAFQRLLFMIRDWSNRKEFEFGLKGGYDFLEYKKENQKDKFCSPWAKLENCYSDIGCCMLPSLGDKAEDLDFNGEISKLKPGFVQALRELVPSILSPDRIVTKLYGGKEIECWRILNLFKEATEQLTSIKSIDIEEYGLTSNISIINNAHLLARHHYLEQLQCFEQSEQKALQKEHFDAAETAALELFDEKTELIDDEQDEIDIAKLELVQFFAHTREIFPQLPRSSLKEASKMSLFHIKWGVLLGMGLAGAATCAKLYFIKTI
ncbi:atlastin-2-like [Panonychus citri]|uniref:atlastin-2-like n=1 Tax=Panonychus citri TaxID=50023 RepID=UPI002307D8F8|nr:atlastin-2-like [Panonychus citri]